MGVGVAGLVGVALWRKLPGNERRSAGEDEVNNPRWGVAPGQVYELARGGLTGATVTVSSVLPPTHDTPYLRVAALVEAPCRGAAVDLHPSDRPGDGFVPVGAAAEEMSPGQALSQVGAVVNSGQALITPGYVMLIPADRPRDDEPALAGFRLRPGTAAPPSMDGYARLLTWAELGQRLRR